MKHLPHLHLEHLRLIRLPFLRRLFHPATLRRMTVTFMGISIALIGSSLAVNDHLAHAIHMPHVVWDFTAYTVHAIGLIPAIHSIEPIWRILMAIE